MYRGTTPVHTFILPANLENVEFSEFFITYAQNGIKKLEKTLDDVERSGRLVKAAFSQKETLAFNANSAIYVQIRAKTPAGDALASQWMQANAGEIIKDGEI